jgi:hypothetical protein
MEALLHPVSGYVYLMAMPVTQASQHAMQIAPGHAYFMVVAHKRYWWNFKLPAF